MTSRIDIWLTAYVAAWASNRPADVTALFATDAEYRSYPWGEPVRGAAAIAEWWLRTSDAPDDHRFSWSLLGVDGPRHFVQGRTVYTDGRTYENLWVVDLAEDGRASAFTEWYMESASKALGPQT
jgi:hypothetical protein